MDGRLVLLHGWGANGEDLKPLGDRLARECSKTLDVVCLEAPELHPDQPGGRQWYGLFPAQWDAVPAAVECLKAQLQSLSSPGLGLERTVVFGFSQGGAMALEGGCALPIAGLISCSGYPHPNWAPPQQHPPVLLMHGSDDPVVPFQAMQSIAAQLQPDQCQTLPFKNGLIKRRRIRTPPFPPNHQRQARAPRRACLHRWNQQSCAMRGRGNGSLRRIER